MKERHFLNSDDGMAAISWFITINSGNGYYYVDSDISISDCSKCIQLDFNSSTPSDAEKRLEKARLLRDVITRFVIHLEEAQKGYKED